MSFLHNLKWRIEFWIFNRKLKYYFCQLFLFSVNAVILMLYLIKVSYTTNKFLDFCANYTMYNGQKVAQLFNISISKWNSCNILTHNQLSFSSTPSTQMLRNPRTLVPLRTSLSAWSFMTKWRMEPWCWESLNTSFCLLVIFLSTF